MSSHTIARCRRSARGRWLTAAALLGVFLAGALSAGAQEPLEITSDEAVVTVKTADCPVAAYQFQPKPRKGFLDQLLSPAGVNILRDAPADHLHHHGLMFAIAVDGVDFWSEHEQCGYQKHAELADVKAYRRHGQSWCTFAQQVDWVGPDAEALLLKEARTIDVCRMSDGGPTVVTWQARLEPPPGKSSVTITGSPYFGLGMRFVESMDKGGKFVNADGKTGVEGTNDVRSAWCAYSAAADGKPVTVTMFDCPANPRFPATWFTMDSAFAYMAVTLNLSKEPLVIESGKPLELRYAVALWDGQIDPDRIEKLYRQLGEWFSPADAQ